MLNVNLKEYPKKSRFIATSTKNHLNFQKISLTDFAPDILILLYYCMRFSKISDLTEKSFFLIFSTTCISAAVPVRKTLSAFNNLSIL